MNRRSVVAAAIVALGMLIAWWVGILYLDGALAAKLPYHQYEMAALLYPDVFYPALPGWILAHAQPFAIGFWLVALGWMLALPVAIGAGAVNVASRYEVSSTATAATFVVALFVIVTILEAAATVLA